MCVVMTGLFMQMYLFMCSHLLQFLSTSYFSEYLISSFSLSVIPDLFFVIRKIFIKTPLKN